MDNPELLANVLRESLAEFDLSDFSEELTGQPHTDSDGDEVTIDEVVPLADAGFLTDSPGVVVRLSDGGEYTIEIRPYRLPRSAYLD